jgi:hypothetical protein
VESCCTPTAQNWATIVTDRFEPSRIPAISPEATWDGVIRGQVTTDRVAADIPWLAWTNERHMSTGEMLLDPIIANRLWLAEGIGVWTADVPNAPKSPESMTFTSRSKGIEQLMANDIVSPPGGKPIVAARDRPVFYVANPDVFPNVHGPDNQHAIVTGWALEYAATDPTFIVGLMNW